MRWSFSIVLLSVDKAFILFLSLFLSKNAPCLVHLANDETEHHDKQWCTFFFMR